jgi:hypothetical protein
LSSRLVVRTSWTSHVACRSRRAQVALAVDCCQSRNVTEVVNATCLNCAAPLSGPFCGECGQRDVPAYPSTKELVVDAVSEFSGWDGRLASTLRTLVRAPGKLTLEFLEGRRVRYISPLRLYLTASVVYFLLAASSPDVRLGSADLNVAGVRVTRTVTGEPGSRPGRVAHAASKSMKQEDLTPEERAAAVADVAHAPSLMRPFLERAIVDPAGFKQSILENMPRLLFVLLPIFAGIIGLFYRQRKYPEHLFFALHLYAFVFLALALTELTKFSRIPIIVGAMSFLTIVGIPAYSTVAFRRVYGGGVVKTLGKEVAIGVLYGIVSIVAFIVMIYVVTLSGPR